MLRKLAFVLVLAFFVTSLTACSALPDLLGIKKPGTGKILFADGFENTDSGWSTWKNEESSVTYQDGGLRMIIYRARFDIWSRPALRFTDALIQVDARRLSGPENNDFGVLCRYRNSDNFYAFLVSSDKYYGIVRMQNGQYTVLSGGEMQYSEAIQPGDAVNHLRGDCVGSDLRLYINDTLLAQTQDENFKSGEVGLVAGSFDQPGVDVWFDNFIVLKP